jgi:SpoVK/Ycf46/Vps4 family AAA+-type ATPase
VSSHESHQIDIELTIFVEPVKLRDLTPVEFKKKAFEKLVIKREYKNTVQALVSTYAENYEKFQDLVEGKGRGLVILLHGAPGTGKTLTAGKNLRYSMFRAIP